MTQFDKVYQKLVLQILNDGVEDYNERSKFYCKAIPGAHFNIDLSKGFPLLSLRRIPLRIFIAEQLWFLLGENDPVWLRPFTKIWDDFIEDDGKVTSYGYRWRKHFGRDQFRELINTFKVNLTSRQAIVLAWDPLNDGLTAKPKKNVPCLLGFSVNIIGGKLCLHNILRSQDVFLGLPHDVAGFALLAHIIAQELGVEVGTYSHSMSNAHFYSDQYGSAEELIKRKNPDQKEIKLILPEHTLDRAEKGDVTLIDEIEANLKSQYKPLAPIKGIRAH
jgi:thymidylate synthase